MAHPNHTYQGREPFRDPWAGPRPDQHLSHKVSALSDAGDQDGRYDPDDGPHPLRGRESIVSLESEYDRRSSIASSAYASYGPARSYSPASWTGSFSYTGAGYAPVNTQGGGPPPSRTLSRGSRKPSYSSVQQTVPQSIREEETYDLSLLQGAAPMGTSRPSARGGYEAIREQDEDLDAAVPAFDFTATLGPMTSHDSAFIKKLQEQEARGNLTGGLGQGFRANSQVRSSDLLTSPTVVQRSLSQSLSRSFSRRNPSRRRRLDHAEALRHVGQDEANRRGEVIEVIVEEPVGADLSNIEGPNIASGGMRQSTYPTKEKATTKTTTQTFYPQPNWKPFSMRWPYLTGLVVVSLALAVMQEVLFQMYKEKPLVKFTSPDQLRQRLGEGKTYGLGWFVGRDGQKHCGVDQEELICNYKHGISLRQGTQPWNIQWDVL
ncbi:hypothetical protein M440DRAFT_1390013 [Trichoderma longibrachiatum ATCC 18648]|uniref:Uncharacterized protein n=1 Tax=Trichoderma longibrachiatum ATCC 18648 TaxID=983965 RepID=A0A2T4C9R4_TRILO|nr:hypothetical protein M440DRAFT_1390013 [Trichoderma longibrachiatum ATCC 18648]